MSEIINEIQLPEIDLLIKMAINDPQGLERIREQLCSQLIENAPQKYRKRLYGLQFQIDMERRRSKNPMHSCIKLSQMMLDSYQNMQDAITRIDQAEHPVSSADFESCRTPEADKFNADILDFTLAREN